MSFWDDISRFAGNLTGGLIGDSDEERRRRQQQQAKKPAPNLDVFAGAKSPAPKPVSAATPGRVGAAVPARKVVNPFPSMNSNPEFDRRRKMEDGLQQGRSFEDIANETGLGLGEISTYAEQTRPGYGKKPLNIQTIQEGAGKLLGDTVEAVTGIVRKPIETAKFADPKSDKKAELQALQDSFNRGEISPGRLLEDSQKITKDIIGKKIIQDDKGNIRLGDKNPLEFGQEFTDAGYNAASVLPIATGAKAATAGTKLLPTMLREGGIWGTVDTTNDIIQGQATPEQTLANYGLNAGMAGLGHVGGTVYKNVRMAQAGPNAEAGSVGLLPEGQSARDRFGNGRDLGDKTAPKFDNRPETLLARATEAGMTPETATSLMKAHGANKFRIMLDTSNGLSGAKNADALATKVLKDIPDGSKQIGGVAKTDPETIKILEEAAQSDIPVVKQTAEDALAGLRAGAERPTPETRATKMQISHNTLERIIDSPGWERDKEYIALGKDGDQKRLAQVLDRRMQITDGTYADQIGKVMGKDDIVHYVDKATGEEIASYHRDDLAAKVEAYSIVRDRVGAPDATPQTRTEAAPQAAPDAPATQPVKVPTTVKELTQATPQRGDLEGHARSVQDIEAFAYQLTDQVSAMLAKTGHTFQDMYKAIDDAARQLDAGAKNVEIDTPLIEAYRFMRAEMDKAYKYRQGQQLDGRKADNFGDRGELYLPRSSGGKTNTSMLDRIEDASVLRRRNSTDERALAQDQMDMSPSAISRYFVEMLGGKDNQLIVNTIEQAKREGRDINVDQAMRQIDQENVLIKQIDDGAKSGKVRQVQAVQQLADIGEAKGKQVTTISSGVRRAPYLEAFRQLLTLPVDAHRTLDDILGKPLRAGAYAHDLIARGGDIIEDIKNEFPELSQQDIANFANKYQKQMDRFTDEAGDITAYQTAAYENIYRKAAVQNAMNFFETHRFTDKYTNDLVNYQLGPMLVKGRIDQNFGQKLSRIATSMTDRSLRGWNIKSAMVELTEMQKLPTIFGKRNFGKALAEMRQPGAISDMIERYGKQESVGASREFFESNPTILERVGDMMDKNVATKLLKTVANPHVFIKGIEIYRSAVALRTAELHYAEQGLRGRALTDAVWDGFRRASLPSDAETHISVQRNAASRALFQYWQWNVRNTAEDARLAIGHEDLGKIQPGARSRGRFIASSIANKSAIWLLYAGTGTSAAYAFNVFDPFGIMEDQWSGISPEEMTPMDQVVKHASLSPLTSLLGSAYFAYRQEQERVEAIDQGEDYKTVDKSAGFKAENVVSNFQNKTPFANLAPGQAQYKKTAGMQALADKGYYDGADGRVRYMAPETTTDKIIGYVFGRGATNAAKEYNDTADPFFKGFMRDGVEGFIREARKDAVIGKVFGSTKKSERPLSTSSFDKSYNERAKEAFAIAVSAHGQNSDEARRVMKDWIDLGRTYNHVMDDFRSKNPAAYNRWQATFDDNIVSPEKWQIYQGNPEVFEFAKARKLLEEKDLGRAIDPVFKLPTERAKAILSYRSLNTGDDMKQSQFLYKTDWYQQFQDDMAAYGKQFEGKGDPKRSARAKEWYDLSTALRTTEDDPQFNLVKQLNSYEFGSQEGKDFLKANYDAWKAQKDAYDKKRFDTVNRMRQIEGTTALSWDQFKAKIEFESDSRAGSSKGSSKGYYDKSGKWHFYGGSGSSSDNPPNTGVEDTITNFGASAKGITTPKSAAPKLKNLKSIVKTSKRAKSNSSLRINI